MQVTFVNIDNQPVATYMMDVPRAGELVGINQQAFTVNSVRYYLYPNGVSRAIVVVVPFSSQALGEHYNEMAEGIE